MWENWTMFTFERTWWVYTINASGEDFIISRCSDQLFICFRRNKRKNFKIQQSPEGDCFGILFSFVRFHSLRILRLLCRKLTVCHRFFLITHRMFFFSCFVAKTILGIFCLFQELQIQTDLLETFKLCVRCYNSLSFFVQQVLTENF